jgi:hypothetical protein
MSCLYGWGGDQFGALVELWNYESGWYHLADGPGTCWGIPQSCPGSKQAAAAKRGEDWRTNPRVQVRWGLGYVASVHGGTPQSNRNFQKANGWY